MSINPPHAERAIMFANGLLRLALFGYAVGLLGLVWQRMGTSTGSYLFMHHSIPPASVALGERVVSGGLFLLIAVALCRPHVVLLLPVVVIVFLEALCGYVLGGHHFSEWTIAAHVMRYLTPAALILLIITRKWGWFSMSRVVATAWLLRLGLACLFITHGLEAYRLHPGFIDLIIGSAENLLAYRVTESQAKIMLRTIGMVDFIVALGVLLYPARPVLAWLMVWGLVTALSRTTAFGFNHWHEVLLRTGHFLGPLVLWQLTVAINRRQNETREELGAERFAFPQI